MATESVDDELRKILMDVANDYADSVNPNLDGTLYTGPDLIKAKRLLDAYYTRECARKVLEGRIKELDRVPASREHFHGYYLERKKRLEAELRATIQEVGGEK